MFPEGVCLQGSYLLLIVFVVKESVWFENQLFAEDVVLLASSDRDLHQTHQGFFFSHVSIGLDESSSPSLRPWVTAGKWLNLRASSHR